MISKSRHSCGSMQSRSPVRETAAGKRKTACCPCCGCGAVARAWPCCPWRARECCCSWLRVMVGVPGGRGVPPEGAHTHTEGGIRIWKDSAVWKRKYLQPGYISTNDLLFEKSPGKNSQLPSICIKTAIVSCLARDAIFTEYFFAFYWCRSLIR